MEQSGRNRWQLVATGDARKRLGQAKTVAVGCDQLPIGAHGKEGVDGSSPSEGSAKAAEIAAFCVEGTCTSPSMRWVWSRLWSFQIQNALLVSAIAARTRISTRPRAPTPVPPQSSRLSPDGARRGRLERSNRQESVRRASSPASSQRCHQRCAVAGDTLKATAAAFSVIPSAIALTRAKRPASPSLALACRYIRALL